MPGLRFKKRAARRHTVDNLEQNAKDIEAATAEQAQKKKERDKFLELFKSKYPNHAKDIGIGGSRDSGINSGQHTNGNQSSGEEQATGGMSTSGERMLSPGAASVKRSNSLSRKSSDYLFLRYHGEMKKRPIPHILTMDNLKRLFVDAFHLDSQVGDWPDHVLYAQDRNTDQWSELQDPGLAVDTGILLLKDLDQSHVPHRGSLDTDSTDASTTQSSVYRRDNHSQISLTNQKPHMYECIDDFNKKRSSGNQRKQHDVGNQRQQHKHRGDSSSNTSRDVTPPSNAWQTPPRTMQKRVSVSSMAGDRIDEVEKHIVAGGKHLTHSMSSISSVGSPDQVVKAARELQRSVRLVRSDFQSLRALHSRQLQSFEHSMKYTCSQIMSNIRLATLNSVAPGSSLRMRRMELEPEEEAYHIRAQEAFDEFRLLEAAVEELQVDVLQRQCRINGGDVERLASAVASIARSLMELMSRYQPLEASIKDVMERELEVIVLEEKMIKDEGQHLENSIVKCKDLTEMLLSLRKLVSADSDRSFVIPVISPSAEPDRRALLDNIQAITPNHDARMQSIAVAEETRRKKKELLVVDGVKVLARDLRNGKLLLHPSTPMQELDRRQQLKMKQLYLEEKSEKEQSKVADHEAAQRAIGRKRELDRKKRIEEGRMEQKRVEERMEIRRLDEAQRLGEWRKDQQQYIVDEQRRRAVMQQRDETMATSGVLRGGPVGNRRSVAMETPATHQPPAMNQRYNSSGVPNRTSLHIPSSNKVVNPLDQVKRADRTPKRPISMDVASSTPHGHHKQDSGGFPHHHQVSMSVNPTRQHSRVAPGPPEKTHNRSRTLEYRLGQPENPHKPVPAGHTDSRSGGNQATAAMLNNHPPSGKQPPQKRQPYTTTYTNTDHGPTLYSMV